MIMIILPPVLLRYCKSFLTTFNLSFSAFKNVHDEEEGSSDFLLFVCDSRRVCDVVVVVVAVVVVGGDKLWEISVAAVASKFTGPWQICEQGQIRFILNNIYLLTMRV